MNDVIPPRRGLTGKISLAVQVYATNAPTQHKRSLSVTETQPPQERAV